MMYSNVSVGVVGLALGFAAGFSAAIMPAADDTDLQWEYLQHKSVVVDQLTGCHYLTPGSGRIFPRLTPDGTHYCGEAFERRM